MVGKSNEKEWNMDMVCLDCGKEKYRIDMATEVKSLTTERNGRVLGTGSCIDCQFEIMGTNGL